MTLPVRVPHDLELDLLPAGDALLDQHLVHRGQAQAVVGDLMQLLLVVADAAAGAAQGKGRTDNDGIADALAQSPARPPRSSTTSEGMHGLADATPCVSLNCWRSSALSMDSGLECPAARTPYCVQEALLGQLPWPRFRPVWPPRVGRMASGCSFSMIRVTDSGGQRLDIDMVGDVVVGHDGGGVGVDQHDLHALLLQGAAGLGAGVVELRRLADDDGAGADDQHLFDIGSLGIGDHPSLPSYG